MTFKLPRVFVRVLLFGLLLGATSTAYADTVAVTSFSISNLQFIPVMGTAQFTPTSTTGRGEAGNSFGESSQRMSNTFPLAEVEATVLFAGTRGTADATTNSLSGLTGAGIGSCSCSAFASSVMTLSGTLVILGGEGNVDVDISALMSQFREVQTDQFGVLGESEILFDLLVNGSPVFSFQFELLSSLGFPNGHTLIQTSRQLSDTIRLQFGVENTISARLLTRSLVVNEVPEPATVLLLISGLGFMTGVLKKRRQRVDR